MWSPKKNSFWYLDDNCEADGFHSSAYPMHLEIWIQNTSDAFRKNELYDFLFLTQKKFSDNQLWLILNSRIRSMIIELENDNKIALKIIEDPFLEMARILKIGTYCCPSYTEVQFFKHQCVTCHAILSAPDLGDFSYGLFIFNCECGIEFTYFDMASSDEYKKIKSLCEKHDINLPSKLFLDCLAYLSDKSHDDHFSSQLICPHCRSTSFNTVERDIAKPIKIATYNHFNSLSANDLIKKIKKFISL